MIKRLFTQESKTIAGAALIIGASTVVSRFLGLVRDRLLVGRFGIGDALDAYYASFQVPNFIFALLVLGTLSVAFIPVFTEYLAKGKKEEAWHMTNSILTIVYAGMGAVCLGLSFGAPWLVRIIAPGFSGQKLALTTQLTRVMMLSPFFFAVSAVFSSVLNSFKHFLTVALAPLLYNGSIIFGIVVLTKPFGILGVSYGAIIGAILHIAVQLPAVMHLGWRSRLVFDARHPGVRQVGKLFLPRVFGIDISQLSQFIGTSIGTTLGVGAPAVFNLAMNISAVPVGVFSIPFAIAAFPDLSEAIAKGDRPGFVRTFAATARQILFFLVPLSAIGWILRIHIVRVLIGSSSLTWDETRIVAAAVGFFVVSLVFQGLVPLLARAFYALKNTIIPVIVSGLSVAANVGAIYLFGVLFRQVGVIASAHLMMNLFGIDDLRVLSLPAAFSLASVLQVALLGGILRHRFGRIGGRGVMMALLKFLVAALVAMFATGLTLGAMPILDDHSSVLTAAVQAAVASAAGLAAYAIVLWFLKSEELTNFTGSLKRKMLRVKKPMPIQQAESM